VADAVIEAESCSNMAKTSVTWMRKLLDLTWILLSGDTPNFAAFRPAKLERFLIALVPDFGSKQDPFISALA
jgi:hypothetical protein